MKLTGKPDVPGGPGKPGGPCGQKTVNFNKMKYFFCCQNLPNEEYSVAFVPLP